MHKRSQSFVKKGDLSKLGSGGNCANCTTTKQWVTLFRKTTQKTQMPLVNIYTVNIHHSSKHALQYKTKSEKSERPQQRGVPLRLFDGFISMFVKCSNIIRSLQKRTWNVQIKWGNSFFSKTKSREQMTKSGCWLPYHFSTNANLKKEWLLKHLRK